MPHVELYNHCRSVEFRHPFKVINALLLIHFHINVIVKYSLLQSLVFHDFLHSLVCYFNYDSIICIFRIPTIFQSIVLLLFS